MAWRRLRHVRPNLSSSQPAKGRGVEASLTFLGTLVVQALPLAQPYNLGRTFIPTLS